MPKHQYTGHKMPNTKCQHDDPDMSGFQYDGPDMHNPATPAAARDMDLQLIGIGDETLKLGKWKRKLQIHTLVKNSYQSDKPHEDGNWWKLSGDKPTIPGAPACCLPVIVARLSAYIPLNIPKNNTWTFPFKTIEEECFIVRKQLAKWIKKWMKLVHANNRNFSHLLVAAPKVSYTASDFEKFMPVQVKGDYNQFVNEFIGKHKGNNPKLKKEHISVFFTSLICGLELFDQMQISDHYKEIHGIEQNDLKLETAFLCPSLHGIEEMGEVGRAMITEVIFHRCRDSGMLFPTENGFSITHHRAQELVTEIKKASSMQYFQRFFVILEQALRSEDLQASSAFSCDWTVIQEALTSAIGEDQAINRMLLAFFISVTSSCARWCVMLKPFSVGESIPLSLHL